MGHIRQDVSIKGKKPANVRMLVDTGATFSVIPKALARELGIAPSRHSMMVTLADGRRRRWPFGLALFRIGDREVGSTLLVGDVAEPILGVETLEALGLAVDPRKGRLIPTRSYTVRV